MAELPALVHVSVVAVDHRVFTGDVKMVVATTTEGELGVLPGHAPLLGQLIDGTDIRLTTDDGEQVFTDVKGGYISVTDEGVSIPLESVEAP